MQVFLENSWFRSLPIEDAQALLAVSVPMTLAPGQAVFHQGDVDGPGWAFLGVCSGLLKMSILHPEGGETIITMLEPGNWFGEVAMVDHLPRGHAVVAMEEVELLVVNAEKFAVLMQRNGFARAMAGLLAARLRLAVGMMGDSALHTVRRRVERRLTLLAHGDVSQRVDGRSSISISQSMLAMMLGISRPTLNKELQAMAREGVISLRYGRIEINDQLKG